MSEGPSFELLVAAALLLPDLDTISVGKAKSELRTNPSGDTPWRLKNPQVRDALQAAREQLRRDREQLAFNNLIQLASPQAWHYMLEHFAPDPQAIPVPSAVCLLNCSQASKALQQVVTEVLYSLSDHPLASLRVIAGWQPSELKLATLASKKAPWQLYVRPRTTGSVRFGTSRFTANRYGGSTATTSLTAAWSHVHSRLVVAEFVKMAAFDVNLSSCVYTVPKTVYCTQMGTAAMAFSPDHSLLCTVGCNGNSSWSSMVVCLFDTVSGQLLATGQPRDLSGSCIVLQVVWTCSQLHILCSQRYGSRSWTQFISLPLGESSF